MMEILNQQQEIVDAPDAKELSIYQGKVEFSNASFGYNSDRIVLKNVSFVVPPGKTVGIVGPSGAGKSTIMRLLFRFYDLNSGTIEIDGQDIKTVQQNSLRQAIGNYISYNNRLFHK